MAEEVTEVIQPRSELTSGLFKDYEFYRRSYEGGRVYKEGHYLIRHARESQTDYENREDRASYVNFCADVVDIYNSYQFREAPSRDWKGKDSIVEEFEKDADLEGRPWARVMRQLSKMAGYYGAMGVIVDKPVGTEETSVSKAAELNAGIRPYVVTYTPLAIWDWTFEKGRTGETELSMLLLEEDNDGGPKQLKQWFIGSWKLWEATTGNKYKIVDEGVYSAKKIPFALLRNRDSMKKMTGISDIADIAYVNRRIYYMDSDALEIIENCAYPMLEGAAEAIEDQDGKDQEKVIGSTALLKRGPGGVDEAGFRWIEATHSSLEQIGVHRASAVEDLRYMSKTGQTEAQKQQAESGVALEIRFQQLTAILSDKAENAESFERKVFLLIGIWMGKTYDPQIKYARRFGIMDLMHELDEAINSKLVISSETYAKEVAKKFVPRMLPSDTKKEVIEKIYKELETAKELPGSEDDSGGDTGDTE